MSMMLFHFILNQLQTQRLCSLDPSVMAVAMTVAMMVVVPVMITVPVSISIVSVATSAYYNWFNCNWFCIITTITTIITISPVPMMVLVVVVVVVVMSMAVAMRSSNSCHSCHRCYKKDCQQNNQYLFYSTRCLFQHLVHSFMTKINNCTGIFSW